LSPDGDDVISGFAEAATADNRRFAHLDGAMSGFDHLAANGAFLLGIRVHFFAPHFQTTCIVLIGRKTANQAPRFLFEHNQRRVGGVSFQHGETEKTGF
jgi:hypothetical protein